MHPFLIVIAGLFATFGRNLRTGRIAALWAIPLLILGVMASATPAAATEAAGRGALESVTVNQDRSITLTGWAISHRPDVFVTYARVWLDDVQIYEGRLGYATARTDVAQSLGNPLWETSGFNLPLAIPDSISAGPAQVRMQIMLGNQSVFDVTPIANSNAILLPEAPARPSFTAQLLFWIAVGLPLLIWLVSPWRPGNQSANTRYLDFSTQSSDTPPAAAQTAFVLAIAASFILLVAGGWTGSSLTRLLNNTPVVTHDGSVWMGRAQDVRADEWQVVTPLAISQIQQTPRFPTINPLHGQPGQNMNVVGMTGAPIANAAAIARPAIWGFFFLDMRRALAWDWWFPFFACFGAVFALLQRWFASSWKLNALLASTVAFSGYSVSWSGWPAYATFFPVAAAVAADVLFRSTRWWPALLASAALGWAMAGFVLVLYPGWQIPLGYLIGIVGLAAIWHFRAQVVLRWPQVVGILLAVAAAACLLAAWWWDASDAIRTLSNTVYPGQRSIDLGGYADPWHLSKGLTNAITLYNASQWSIASDAGNFIYVLPPLALATVLVWCLSRGPDAISLALWAFIGFVCWYMFWGLPGWLARSTLWSMAPAFRLDVALGLAQTFLLAWLAKQWQHMSLQQLPVASTIVSGLGAIGAAAFVCHTAWQMHAMPAPLQNWLPLGLTGLMYAACAALAYLLITGRMHAALLLYAGWTLGSALPFNPIGQAPRTIAPVAAIAPYLQSAQRPDEERNGQAGITPARPQVAVVGQTEWSNALASAGVPVLNSTFYEPPLAFWARLDPEGRFTSQYNRYQHLHLMVTESETTNAPYFTVGAPTMDRVELRLHPSRFDFRLLKVEFVLTNATQAAALQNNASLHLVAQTTGSWALFEVRQAPSNDRQVDSSDTAVTPSQVP